MSLIRCKRSPIQIWKMKNLVPKLRKVRKRKQHFETSVWLKYLILERHAFTFSKTISTFWKETLLLLSSLFQRSQKDKHFDQLNTACNTEEQHYLVSPDPADCTFKHLSLHVKKKNPKKTKLSLTISGTCSQISALWPNSQSKLRIENPITLNWIRSRRVPLCRRIGGRVSRGENGLWAGSVSMKAHGVNTKTYYVLYNYPRQKNIYIYKPTFIKEKKKL